MTKDTISYNSFVNYKSFVIQKIAVQIIIDLNAEVFAVKIVVIKGFVLGIVKVDRDDIRTKIFLIEQDIMVLL